MSLMSFSVVLDIPTQYRFSNGFLVVSILLFGPFLHHLSATPLGNHRPTSRGATARILDSQTWFEEIMHSEHQQPPSIWDLKHLEHVIVSGDFSLKQIHSQMLFEKKWG